MGKIRIKTIGAEDVEQEEKKATKVKKDQRKAREAAENVSVEEVVAEPIKTEKVEVKQEKKVKIKKEKFREVKEKRSQFYKKALASIIKAQYSLPEALDLLKTMQRTKFDETIEMHINVLEQGVSGQVTLPHGSGKQTRVAIASDKLISEIEKGEIEFDVLLAEPSMMPKLAKVARVLGPKGLMPNPKNGTISAKPEELAKKYQGGQINFKTEAKIPVIHLTVGKASFGNKKLEENIKAILNAIKSDQIKKVVLSSTMSPGIKLAV